MDEGYQDCQGARCEGRLVVRVPAVQTPHSAQPPATRQGHVEGIAGQIVPITRLEDGRQCIGCDGCDNYFHPACIRMSRQELRRLEKSGLEWHCDECSSSRQTKRVRSARNCKSIYK